MLDPIQQTKLYDYNALYYGYPLEKLMENAGRGIARVIKEKYGKAKKIAIICGPGNNGGDGLVAARYLSDSFEVKVFLVPEEEKIKSELTRKNWEKLKTEKHSGITASDLSDDFDVVVDCMFGAGISGKLKEPYKSLVAKLNRLKAKKISVDLPTPGFKADLIISLMVSKDSQAITVDIGYPAWLKEKIGVGEIKVLNRAGLNSHKGKNGQCLIIAGSEKYHGALLLSANMAAKIADLVYVYSTRENQKIIKKIKPRLAEFIAVNKEEVEKTIKKVESVLIGPGVEINEGNQKLINDLVKKYPEKKFVLDAGALQMIEKKNLGPNCLLTPHSGEFKNLFGILPNKSKVKKMAQKYNCAILLKGKKDIISNGGEIKINETGNPGMTKGGTGDVLAGLATALAGRNDLFLSACAAAF